MNVNDIDIYFVVMTIINSNTHSRKESLQYNNIFAQSPIQYSIHVIFATILYLFSYICIYVRHYRSYPHEAMIWKLLSTQLQLAFLYRPLYFPVYLSISRHCRCFVSIRYIKIRSVLKLSSLYIQNVDSSVHIDISFITHCFYSVNTI